LKLLKNELDIKKNKLLPQPKNKKSFIDKFDNSAKKENKDIKHFGETSK